MFDNCDLCDCHDFDIIFKRMFTTNSDSALVLINECATNAACAICSVVVFHIRRILISETKVRCPLVSLQRTKEEEELVKSSSV